MNYKLIFYRTIFSCIVSVIILTIVSFFMPHIDSYIQCNKSFKLNNKIYSLNTYEHTIASSCIVPCNEHSIENIIGHEDIMDEINTIVDLLNCEVDNTSLSECEYGCPKGILLYGPPGTGKTTLAKSLSSAIKGSDKKTIFINVSPDVIENKYYGESLKLLKAVFTLANKLAPCVIFFDEIDGVVSKRTALDQSHTLSMKTSFLTHLDSLGKSVLLIGATNRQNSLDPALLRRMGVHLKLDTPSFDDKCEMIKRFFSKLDDVSILDLLSNHLPEELSLSDLENFCKYCLRHFYVKHKKNVYVLDFDDIVKMYSKYKKFIIMSSKIV